MADRGLPPAMGRRIPPTWVVRPGLRLRNLLGRAHREAVPPALAVLEQMDRMIEGRVVALAVDSGLIDAVGGRDRCADELAGTLGLEPDATFRVLRYLVSKGWVSVDGDVVERPTSRFALTQAGALLREDHPEGLRDWTRFVGASWMSQIWDHAEHSLRTGESASVAATGLAFFDFLATDQQAESVFDGAMRAGSGLQSKLLAGCYDFARYRRICDVGGGTGQMLVSVLGRAAASTGVLLERESVIERARERAGRRPRRRAHRAGGG